MKGSLWICVLLVTPVLLLNGCGQEGKSEAEQACLDISAAMGDLCERCQAGSGEACREALESQAGGCESIKMVRDSNALYEECIPWFDSASCQGLMSGALSSRTAARASCSSKWPRAAHAPPRCSSCSSRPEPAGERLGIPHWIATKNPVGIRNFDGSGSARGPGPWSVNRNARTFLSSRWPVACRLRRGRPDDPGGGGQVRQAARHRPADRPFLYLIRDLQTNAVLFLGRVTDPSDEG